VSVKDTSTTLEVRKSAFFVIVYVSHYIANLSLLLTLAFLSLCWLIVLC